MKKFYSHLVEIESLTAQLETINLDEPQKHQLAQLADSNIHNIVMDAILSRLSEGDKRKFAEIVLSNDHKKIWDFLRSKADGVEEDIKKAVIEFKKKLHEDVKEAREK